MSSAARSGLNPMTDIQPTQTTNLDRYGYAELPWSRPRDILAAGPLGHEQRCFLGTVRPDGRPHAAGIGTAWFDGDLFIVSSPQTRKSRNLAANPACTISLVLDGIDLVFEGEATRVTDQPTLEVAGRRLQRGRVAGRGRGRRVHRALQRAQRRAAAVVRLPLRLRHGLRRRDRGALRRDPLALRALTRTLEGMTDEELDLDAIRRELESRRESTSERVATLAERPELGSAQGFGKRIGDGTTEAISRLTEIGVGRSLETGLARTERALAKLDEGTYGTCDACGEAIPPKRLRAMPDSVLCVACAAAERRRHDPRRR